MVAAANPNWRGGRSRLTYPYKLTQKARYPERVAAREAVYRAIRAGRLCRASVCACCGVETKTHAHHHDYSEPLAVTWLCRACHRAEHDSVTLKQSA